MKSSSISLLLAVGLLAAMAGCSTGAKSSSKPGKAEKATTETKDAKPKVDSTELSEARVEALSRFANGVSLDMRGQPREAVDEFRKAALADPGNEALVTEVARRLLRARQIEKAIEILTVASKQPKAASMVHVLLGAAYGQQGKLDLAVAALRKALTVEPKLFPAYQNLFTVYLQAGKFKEAREILDEAEKKVAGDADQTMDLAEMFARYGQARPTEIESIKARALAVLERAQKQSEKDDPTQMLRIADGFRAFGDLKRATELYTQVLKMAPDFPGIREKLAEGFLRGDEPEKAKEQIKSILRDNPTNPQLYYLLGTIAAEAKDEANREANLKEAAGYFEKVLVLKPDFEPAYFDLASVRIGLKQIDAALKIIDKARIIVGETFLVDFYSGLAHSQNKDYAAAVRDLTSAELKAKTGDTNRLTVGFYFQLGAAHERNKNYTEAEKYFRTCLKMQPDFSEALNYLGYMWAEHNQNLKEAHEMISKAVKLEPENGAFLDSMAWVLFQMGKAKDAIPWAEKSLKFTKEPDPTLFDHLGDIYLKADKREQARDAWKKSLEIEANPDVKKKLDGLGGKAK